MPLQPQPFENPNHVEPAQHGFFASSKGKISSKIILLIISLLVLIPILPLLTAWLKLDGELWQHLWQTQLVTLLENTLILSLLVGIGAFALGVSLAWLLVIYEFPGRKILQWGLMLPLAIPPYILAFVFLGFSDFGGALHQSLQWLGLPISWLPDIRSSVGVALVFILSLYPYVYLLMRAALIKKGRTSYESARTLGYSKRAAFWRLIIPMTRPAWIAGLALVLMETLADFGAVSIFNYDTFTTAIYKSWFGLFSLETAAQLASILLLLVFLALIGERWGRGQGRFTESGTALQQHRKPLKGIRGFFMQAAAWLVFAVGFILPLIQLLYWSFGAQGFSQGLDQGFNRVLVELLTNSVVLALIATLATLAVALLMAFAQRRLELQKAYSKRWSLLSEFGLLGYALPGTVLAVGVVLSLNALEATLGAGQWLIGGIFALCFAYVIRFLRIAQGPVANSMAQIKPSLIEAARSLGAEKKELLYRVYLPLLRPGVLTAILLIFVEVMKEMPATLLLRPFGWDTLSVRIYELTSEGEWQLAALPAVLLVVVGILPVIYLIKKSEA